MNRALTVPKAPVFRRIDRRLHQQELIECPYTMDGSGRGLKALWRECENDPGSSVVWEALLKRVLPPARKIVVRAVRLYSLARSDSDDLLQEICLKMCQVVKSRTRMPDTDLEFEACFRTLAANVVRDRLRHHLAVKRSRQSTVRIDDHFELLRKEVDRNQDSDSRLMMRAIDERLDCSTRDRAVFWLYYRQGWSCAEIAAIPSVGLSTKGVESLIQRMTSKLREKFK